MRELAKSRDPRAVEALRDLLDDPDVFLRYHAARNVLRNPDGFRTIVIRAVEQILAILGNPDRPWRPGWLPPTDREIVDLVKENQDLPAEAFIAALTHSNWEVRKMAAGIFSRRDDGHVPVEPFVRALTYDDPNVRRAAAQVLAKRDWPKTPVQRVQLAIASEDYGKAAKEGSVPSSH